MRQHTRKKRYSRKFSGIRTDTKPVREIERYGGNRYLKREDDSNYPKLTSIPVSPSVRQIYFDLRTIGKYSNYDELLLSMFEKMLQSGQLGDISQFNEVDRLLTRAKIDVRLRLKARNRAMEKGRYRPR